VEVNKYFEGTISLCPYCRQIIDLFSASFILVSCLAYTSILKTEEICSSETSVDFYRNTLCYIPEDKTPQNLRRFKENLPSYASRHLTIQEVATKALISRSGWCCGRNPNWLPLSYSNRVEATYPAGHVARMFPDEKPSRCTRAALNKSYSVH
jgi:hypothetical protein